MPRSFVDDFLLPLVTGGPLHVGRPLWTRSMRDLIEGSRSSSRDVGAGWGSHAAIAELAIRRRALAATLVPGARAPRLDDITLRLGAAVHNLLSLGHPDLQGPGLEKRQDRIAQTAERLASVGSPGSEVDALERHTLLARLAEIERSDHTVRYWLGRMSFVGRAPPGRVTIFPRLRGVKVESWKRNWLREIGVPAVGRAALLALGRASPLGEALDPLRLDPSPSWGRLLPILRFPRLARVVACRWVDLGVDVAGSALASALVRYGAHQIDDESEEKATPATVAFGIRFLAHTVWLQHAFAPGAGTPPPSDLARCLELGALLVTAEDADPTLVWPPDVARTGSLGVAFAARLALYRGLMKGLGVMPLESMAALCRFAAGGEESSPAGMVEAKAIS